jgi:hypothetical protein
VVSVEYYWQPGSGSRHVVLGRWFDAREETVTALCGEAITATSTCSPEKTSWLWPTCLRCDRQVRELLGLPAMPHGRAT